MASIGYATLQIIPSARGFTPALESQIAPSMATVGSSAGQKFTGGFASQLKTMAGPIAAAVSAAAVGSFLKASITEASNFAETISKVNVIFGDTAESLKKWSENSAKAMGMSNQQALDAASSFAIFASSAGLTGDSVSKFSTGLTGLASDFGSFYNTSPEDAIIAISAALRGESEPIRKYNILLNEAGNQQQALKMGLIKTTKEALTPQQRVLAVQAQIWEQSAVAQGDFARTSGGVANKSRIVSAEFHNLKTRIGTGLLPTVLLLQKGMLLLLKVINKIPGPVAVFVAVFATVITAFVVGRTAVTLFKSAMIALNAVIKGNVILVIVAAVIALVAALVYAYTHSEKFRKIVNTGFIALAKVVGTVVGYIIGFVSTLIKVYVKVITTILSVASHLPFVGEAAAAAKEKIAANASGITDALDKMAIEAKGSMTKMATALTEKMPKISDVPNPKAKKVVVPKVAGDTAAIAAARGTLAKNLDAAFIKAVQGSPDSIKAAFAKLAANVKTIGSKVLIAAVADTQKKILALASKRDALAEQYKSAKESLSSLKDEAAAYLKSVSDAVIASGNIANGRSFTNMVRTLTLSVTKAKEFNTVIAGLKAAGLNNTSLSQLVEAGPAAGLKAAKALLGSGSGGIAIINDLTSQLKGQGDAIGKTVTSSIYDAAITESEKAMKKIGDDLTAIENQIVTVAAAFAKELAKIGKIPAPTWLKDLASVTNNTVPKTVSAITSPGSTTASGVSGSSVAKSSPTIQITTINPIAEPTSVTVSRTMTKLAMIGAFDR